ncbi:hypothetical protein SAY86_018604 [Trapa natans]|uniref:Methyltransferase n=1 Tax=Trapa natans TaxID=22666 RepID=A0AAN7LNK2_TRANT|nr:hypothetical protein SAY86_018604 [Trapa natans]
MAIPSSSSSMQSLLRERKYPFIFLTGTLLLIFLTLISFSFSSSSSSSSSDLKIYSSSSTPTPVIAPSSVSGLPDQSEEERPFKWTLCKGPLAIDYIPCLDNHGAIKKLKSRQHMEHRERHCPYPAPRCLVPIPKGYKVPIPWPKSREMIWFDNVPHPKLVDYKKDQNWVQKDGEHFVFPGGGTQFKHGVSKYIKLIEKILPVVQWGKHVRVALDIGCGVASFGGALLDRDVITLSFAPKDEHEAQIQFALERGIPAILSVIGTKKLIFPDNVYDMIHCARCRIRWGADGGKPLLELNRVLRPGGYFVWSATPVYRKDEMHQGIWNSTISLTKSMCWELVARAITSSWFGLAIFQKPANSSCLETRHESEPPLCGKQGQPNSSWYMPLNNCISRLPANNSWPNTWPERLVRISTSLNDEPMSWETFQEDTKHWSALISDVYSNGIGINWTNVRNIMDMNAGYGGFAAALISMPVWVMNVVPIDMQDTLQVIYDRGLIGVYHDWCESFSTYPRTFDLVHTSFLFENLTKRCDMVEVVAEIDRILRPGGHLLVQGTLDTIKKMRVILVSLYWRVSLHQEQFLLGVKAFWRPGDGTIDR